MHFLSALSLNAKIIIGIAVFLAGVGIVVTVVFVNNLPSPNEPVVGKNNNHSKTSQGGPTSPGGIPESDEPGDSSQPNSSSRGGSSGGSRSNNGSSSGSSQSTGGNSSSNQNGNSTPPSDPPPAAATCELPKYPNPACTGVPAGVQLTTISGNYTANTPGEVVDAMRITGNLYIGAEGITVRNSQIDGTVYNNQGLDHFGFTVTDTTIGPETGCIGQPGINDSRYTARRVEVRGHDDGFRVGTPGEVEIYDSYAKLCFLPPDVAPPDGSHSDGVQAYCPGGICAGLIVDHNTFDSRGITATFMLNLAYDQLREVTATNNMLAGGPYVLVARWFGGPKYEIHNNRIVDQSWVYAPVSGESTCANQNWSGNTIVTINDSYEITSTVRTQDCQY